MRFSFVLVLNLDIVVLLKKQNFTQKVVPLTFTEVLPRVSLSALDLLGFPYGCLVSSSLSTIPAL